MRGKLLFLGGIAAGFVLGARAGREKYEELVRTTQKLKESPTVQDAADVVREQATRLYSGGRAKVNDKLAGSRFTETRFGRRFAGGSDSDSDAAIGESSHMEDDTLTGPGAAAPAWAANTSGSGTSSRDF